MGAKRRSFFAAISMALMAATPWATPAAGAAAYIEGIDVSHWQGKPNWAAAKAAGVRFVIAKATDGMTGVDPQYARNRSRLRANAIPFSAYHYARPDTTPGDAVAEADHFINTARLDGRNLLPVLDFENNANALTPEELADWAATWLARVEERLRVKPMIYTNTRFWTERMADTTSFAVSGYRLWIRDLNVDTPTLPAAAWDGSSWTLWQYTVKGGLPGFSGRVDRNRYGGGTLAPLRIRNNR
jgi:GH25 family lysozyme M1 (1,4-beta-N-acetylmuramidase)